MLDIRRAGSQHRYMALRLLVLAEDLRMDANN